MIVAFFGPDGSGKSSLVDKVEEARLATGAEVSRYHWRPGVFPQRGADRPADTYDRPDELSRRSYVVSLGCYVYFFLDFVIGYLLNRKAWRSESDFVLYERFYYDVLFHPRRYKLTEIPWMAKLLCTLMPTPDLIVVLVGDSEVIHNRKPELRIAEIDRQIRQMQIDLPTYGECLIVDTAENDLEATFDTVQRALSEKTPYPLREQT